MRDDTQTTRVEPSLAPLVNPAAASGVGAAAGQDAGTLRPAGQPGSDAGKLAAGLANLADYWDQLAADQQGIGDRYTTRDRAQSCVALGRSRQLTDCARVLRETLEALTEVQP